MSRSTQSWTRAAGKSEVEYQGINPRLDTLEGKKVIVVNLHGGNEEIMESIDKWEIRAG